MDGVGKARRMARLFSSETGKMLLVPLDDSLLAGPEKGLRNITVTLRDVVRGGADAVMGFQGFIGRHSKDLEGVAVVVNLTASTVRSWHTRKVQVCSVERAVKIGADCVGVHINISSQYEPEMLAVLGKVSEDCERYGIPLMGLMYPRGEVDGQDYNYDDLRCTAPDSYAELVRHCVRIGVELGVDLIKTQFTGDKESFRSVIESAMGVPIVIAGGPLEAAESAFTKARQSILAGGSGVSFGRNVFQRGRPGDFVKALRAIVHSGPLLRMP